MYCRNIFIFVHHGVKYIPNITYLIINFKEIKNVTIRNLINFYSIFIIFFKLTFKKD